MVKSILIQLVICILVVPSFAQQNIIEQYNLRNYAQVIVYSDNVIETGEATYETWYYRGLSQQALYKYHNAIQSFLKAKNLSADEQSISYVLANAWEQSGNTIKAIELYNEILVQDSSHILSLARIAAIQKNKKDWLNAMESYTKLINQDSINAYFYSQLAFCCSKIGLTQHASEYYFTAYKLNTKDFKSVKGFISEIIKQKYYEDAIAYIDSFSVAFPDNIFLLKQKAFLSAIGGNYLQAVEEFGKVTQLGDSSMFTCKYYGQSLYNNGNYAEAIFWLDKYLAKHTDDAKNQLICGIACLKDYQYQNSLDHFAIVENIIYNKKNIAQLAIERAHTQIAYGDYYGFRDSTGRKKEEYYKLGLDSFMEAEGMDPDNPKVYKELGNFYDIKMKDAQLALYFYQNYYNKLDPNKIDGHHLQWIQDKLGELKEEVHFIGSE